MVKIFPAIEKSRVFTRAWTDPGVLMAVQDACLVSQELHEKAQVRSWALVGG